MSLFSDSLGPELEGSPLSILNLRQSLRSDGYVMPRTGRPVAL